MKTICINCGCPLSDKAAFFDCLLPMPKPKDKELRYGRCDPCQAVGRAQNDARYLRESNQEQSLLAAMEYGFVAHEKGNNIQAAREKFVATLRGAVSC